jgi:hypothetical protein
MAAARKMIQCGKYKNRGSVTIMAIGIMMFLGVILSGVLPMITQEVRSGTMNRDVVEAEYAAEAGAKRALLALADSANASWTWVSSDRAYTDDVNVKRYNVTISGIAAGRTTPADAGSYTITSVGTVGQATKTVTVTIDVTRGSGSVFSKYAAYGGTKLNLNSGTAITGDVATNGDLNLTSSTRIVEGTASTYTGNGIPKKNPWGNDWNYNAASAYAQLTEKETLDVASLIPTMPAMSATGTDLATLSGTTLSGSYYYSGNYTLTKPLTASGTVVIYINGDLKLSVSGTNGSITGGNDVTIYATGSIQMDNNTSINVGSGSLKIYTLKNFTMTNNSALTGNQTMILAKQNITLGTNSSINSGAAASVITKIYSNNGDIQFTNNFKLGGTALVATLGSINLNSSISLANTIFVAERNIDVSGSVSSSGLYANGTIGISSGTVNYGTSAQKNATLTALGLNTGGGGTNSGATFHAGSWSSR